MKLEILVGMIASGKSTYARRRASEGALIVSHDDLTTMLHGEYRYEQDLRTIYRRMEESIAWDGLSNNGDPDNGRDVIIDRTHLTRDSRARWVKFAGRMRQAGYVFDLVAVLFATRSPVYHAANRFQADPRGRSLREWDAVAHHHHAQAMSNPFDHGIEGFDRVIDLTEFRPT